MRELEGLYAARNALLLNLYAALDEFVGATRRETQATLDAIQHLPAQERITKEETP